MRDYELARGPIADARRDDDDHLGGQPHELRVGAVKRAIDDAELQAHERADSLRDRFDANVTGRGDAETNDIRTRCAARVRDPSLPHGRPPSGERSDRSGRTA